MSFVLWAFCKREGPCEAVIPCREGDRSQFACQASRWTFLEKPNKRSSAPLFRVDLGFVHRGVIPMTLIKYNPSINLTRFVESH